MSDSTEHMGRPRYRPGVTTPVISKWTASEGRRHVEYTLTRLGEGLVPALDQLEAWGREYTAAHAARADDGSPGQSSVV